MTLKSEKPVFVQIIEMIEDDILSGIYDVDDLIISHHKYPSYCPSTLQRRNEPSVCLQTGGLFIKKTRCRYGRNQGSDGDDYVGAKKKHFLNELFLSLLAMQKKSAFPMTNYFK